MRHFTTAFALVLLALSTAACDPHQAITNALPGGCDPAGEQWSSQGPAKKAGPAVSNVPDVNIPAELPNTKY